MDGFYSRPILFSGTGGTKRKISLRSSPFAVTTGPMRRKRSAFAICCSEKLQKIVSKQKFILLIFCRIKTGSRQVYFYWRTPISLARGSGYLLLLMIFLADTISPKKSSSRPLLLLGKIMVSLKKSLTSRLHSQIVSAFTLSSQKI